MDQRGWRRFHLLTGLAPSSEQPLMLWVGFCAALVPGCVQGRLEALQLDTAENFAELRSMILELSKRIEGTGPGSVQGVSPARRPLVAPGAPPVQDLDNASYRDSLGQGTPSQVFSSARETPKEDREES